MEIYKRFLPIQCYGAKSRSYRPLPLKIDGIVEHYFSGKYAFPNDLYNLDKCWELMHDLNFEPQDRSFNIYSGPRFPASAHFLIGRDGTIIQTVPLQFQAWHAGRSSFNGRIRCNTYMVGIENVGARGVEYTEDQMNANAFVCAKLMKSYSFSNKMITGHDVVAPERKKDPGPLFSYQHLFELIDKYLQ